MNDEVKISHYGKVRKSKERASLEALSWAADRAGKSYGAFITSLEPWDEPRIQAEFEEMLRKREEEKAARRAERQIELETTNVDLGYIITDVDP